MLSSDPTKPLRTAAITFGVVAGIFAIAAAFHSYFKESKAVEKPFPVRSVIIDALNEGRISSAEWLKEWQAEQNRPQYMYRKCPRILIRDPVDSICWERIN